MTGVVDLLRTRRTAGSPPGARTDDATVALVIEGGGNRAAYSAGMALALVELGYRDAFDAVYGTSGGAINGGWFLSDGRQHWLRGWASPEVAARKVTDPRRIVRGRPMVDLELLVEDIYTGLAPMDFAGIVEHPIAYHPMATNARTGVSEDLAPLLRTAADVRAALRASACLPLLAGPPVRVGGDTYLDGGLTEGFAYRTALAQGATHVVVLRTRRSDQTASAATRVERLLMSRYFDRHAAAVKPIHRDRHLAYAAADADLTRRTDQDATIVQVRPPLGSPDIPRLNGSLADIATAIGIGEDAVRGLLAPEAS